MTFWDETENPAWYVDAQWEVWKGNFNGTGMCDGSNTDGYEWVTELNA